MATVTIENNGDAKGNITFRIDYPTSLDTSQFITDAKITPFINGKVVTKGFWGTSGVQRPYCFTSTGSGLIRSFNGIVQDDNTVLWSNLLGNAIEITSNARQLIFRGLFTEQEEPTPTTIDVTTTALRGASVTPTSVQSDATNIQFKITHNAINNGKWTEEPKIECNSSSGGTLTTVSLEKDESENYSGTLASIPTDTASIWVSGTYEEQVTPIATTVEIRNNIPNTTVEPTSYERGTKNLTILIKVTSNKGQWTQSPTAYAYNSSGSIQGTLTFVPSADGTNNYQTVINGSPFGTEDDNWDYIQINGNYELNEYADEYGLIGLYEISDTQIPSGIINSRYPQVSGVYDDTGKYILGYYRYPFAVEKGNIKKIQFGWNNTQVDAPTITKTIYEFTLIDEVINGLYKDNRDIDKAEITLYLPFLQAVTLDSVYINTRIKVTYKVDVVSNKGNVYIYSDDNIIAMYDVVVGFSVPYITGENLGYGNLNGNYLLNVVPTVRVVQRAVIDNSISSVGGRRVLGNIKGYIRAERLEYQEEMPIDAILNIEKLLNAGIINNSAN